MEIKKFKNIWNDFFFTPRPSEGLAFFRIFLGVIILITFLSDILHFRDYWGVDGLQSINTMKLNMPKYILSIFQWITPTDFNLKLILFIHLLANILFIIGFRTRISSIILFVTLVSFHQRNINILSSSDLLLRIFMMIMVFAPSAQSLSVDSWLRKRSGMQTSTLAAPWAQRLIQIQLACVYVSTVLSKSLGDSWLDGSALYYASRIDAFTRFPVPFLFDSLLVLKLLTWSTLIIELALGSLIFIDEFKKPLIFLGILFHLGIEYSMSIPAFEWIMIAGLLTMFKFEDYPQFINKFNSRFLSKS